MSVLEIPLRQSDFAVDGQIGLTGVNFNVVSKVSDFALDLDVLSQVSSEASDVENAIIDWSGAVDGEFSGVALRLLAFVGWCHFFTLERF